MQFITKRKLKTLGIQIFESTRYDSGRIGDLYICKIQIELDMIHDLSLL